FGFVVDYLTYGGLYREAWLEVRPENYVTDVFVWNPDLSSVAVEIETAAPAEGLRLALYNPAGSRIYEGPARAGRNVLAVKNARLWSPESPALYRCAVTLGEDVKEVTFGFRTARFGQDGLRLNGEKLFLRGLNRHQSWPWIGYAGTKSLQWEDARILKEELGVNAVRTSHYPQSQHFLDACDALGLCVFTELPGWQHIGDEAWQRQAVRNVEDMVRQYRNHPSIVLWGVRINESPDADDFYRETGSLAHRLDPSRDTSGVRDRCMSSFLEDVYAYNDFSHSGRNPGCRPKAEVTPDMGKPLLISEHTGHIFPTKSFDLWSRRQEHALRHARVLDAAMADGEHAGAFGWCMFDYATHKDFGSGDKVCYHGVMDAFRNPKLAAYTYLSQSDRAPVLELGSSYDAGDYDAALMGPVWAFTNAEEIWLYRNDVYVNTFRPTGWKALPHGPIRMEDTVGVLLVTQENLRGEAEEAVHKSLLAMAKYGPATLPETEKLRLKEIETRFGIPADTVTALYGKYIGNWGGASTRWRFDAVKGGEVIASVTRAPGERLHLEARASSAALREGDTYDMALVRFRVLDENGCLAPYALLPVSLAAEGEIALCCPAVAVCEGGMGGALVRSTAPEGRGTLTLSAPGLAPVTLRFD
ncbi:MAG: glycoside hydrolase family 2 TIM barrel-domain containing protein, partial [bacterium]